MVLVLFMVVAAFIVFFQFTQPEYQDIQVVRGEEFARRDFVEKQQSAITQVKKLLPNTKTVLISRHWCPPPSLATKISIVPSLKWAALLLSIA